MLANVGPQTWYTVATHLMKETYLLRPIFFQLSLLLRFLPCRSLFLTLLHVMAFPCTTLPLINLTHRPIRLLCINPMIVGQISGGDCNTKKRMFINNQQ